MHWRLGMHWRVVWVCTDVKVCTDVWFWVCTHVYSSRWYLFRQISFVQTVRICSDTLYLFRHVLSICSDSLYLIGESQREGESDDQTYIFDGPADTPHVPREPPLSIGICSDRSYLFRQNLCICWNSLYLLEQNRWFCGICWNTVMDLLEQKIPEVHFHACFRSRWIFVQTVRICSDNLHLFRQKTSFLQVQLSLELIGCRCSLVIPRRPETTFYPGSASQKS